MVRHQGRRRPLPSPTTCSICLSRQGRLQYHSENYYDPLHPHAICVGRHLTLHRRFRSSNVWQRLVAANLRDGAWFAMLRLEPIDLAGDLRRSHGMALTDVLSRVLDELPPEARRPLGALINSDTAP